MSQQIVITKCEAFEHSSHFVHKRGFNWFEGRQPFFIAETERARFAINENRRLIEVLNDEIDNLRLMKSYKDIRIEELEKKVESLTQRVNELVEGYDNVEVVELRDISHDQAKKEITKYFKDGKYHDAGEVADDLRLDIRLVVDVCNELIEEGVIGG